MTKLTVANQIRAAFRNEVLNLVQLKTKTERGVEEFQFHPDRKWRFDLAWPAQRIALEIEGAVWTQGRHTRGSGFVGDVEKYNSATLLGWRVFRCVWSNGKNAEAKAPAMDDGSAAKLICEAILESEYRNYEPEPADAVPDQGYLFFDKGEEVKG